MCFLGGTRIPRMPKHLIRGTPADCFGRGRWRLRRGQLAVRRTAGNSGLRLVSRRDPHLAPCDYRLAQPHTTPYISQGRALPFGWRLAFLSLTCQPAGDMEPALLLQSSCIRYFFAKVKGNRIAIWIHAFNWSLTAGPARCVFRKIFIPQLRALQLVQIV